MNWIIIYAIVLHYSWAAILFVSNDASKTTPISAMHTYLGRSLPIVLIAIASLAVLELVKGASSIRSMLLLFPQQLMLTMTAISAFASVITGVYPDGEPRPNLFILADQLPSLLIFAMHGVAIFQRASHRQEMVLPT